MKRKVWYFLILSFLFYICLIGGENEEGKSVVSLVDGKILVTSPDGNSAYIYDASSGDKIKRIGKWLIEEKWGNEVENAIASYERRTDKAAVHKVVIVYDTDKGRKYVVDIIDRKEGQGWVMAGDKLLYVASDSSGQYGVFLLDLNTGSKRSLKDGVRGCFFERDKNGGIFLIVKDGQESSGERLLFDGDGFVDVDEVEGVSDCGCSD